MNKKRFELDGKIFIIGIFIVFAFARQCGHSWYTWDLSSYKLQNPSGANLR